MKRKLVFRILKVVVLVYCTIGTVLYYLQDRFLFHPEPLPKDYNYTFNVPFEELNIPVNNTDTLNLVKFFPKVTIRKGVVLYYHGNKGNINRYAKFAENFTKQGYEVWMEDYPGFGKTTGTISEKFLYQEALQLYKMAIAKFKKDSIIVYGKSLGTGIAAYVASQTDCKRLILETPYYSIPALFSCYAPIYPTERMTHYKLRTNEYLEGLNIPITIFHGTDDNVIPYRSAARLKKVLKPTDQFIAIDKATHLNINDFPIYHQVLDSLLTL